MILKYVLLLVGSVLIAGCVGAPSEFSTVPIPKKNCIVGNHKDHCIYNLSKDGPQEIEFFANQKCAKTNVLLDSKKNYRVTLLNRSGIQDGKISVSKPPINKELSCGKQRYYDEQKSSLIDEYGFCHETMNAYWSWFRRSTKHEWFELIFSTNNCDTETFIGVSDSTISGKKGVYEFSPTKSGELSLFVNDASFFYKNNKGFYRFKIEEINQQ